MRISDDLSMAILETAREFFGNSCRVILFGSRVHDHLRGGDIDLLIESDLDISEAVQKRWKFLARLCMRFGERSYDVVLTQNAQLDSRAVVQQALAFGVVL